MVRKEIIAPIFLFLTTCNGGSFCSIATPHRFADATVNIMSAAEIKQELAYNKTGEKLCGWAQ